MELGRREIIAGAVAATVPVPHLVAAAAPNLQYRTATDLVAALANHEITSRQLTEGCIARIEAMDEKTNAVVVRDFDRARQAADQADTAIASGDRRPLLGLPMTVRNNTTSPGYLRHGVLSDSRSGS